MQTIGANTFRDNKKLQILKLSNNQIKCLQPSIFKRNLQLEELHLDNNKLTFLESSVLAARIPKLNILSIYNNDWYCDCHLKWLGIFVDRNQKLAKTRALSETSRRRRNLLTTLSEKPPLCASPENVRSRPMFTLKPTEFVCNQAFMNVVPKCVVSSPQNVCPSPCVCSKQSQGSYVVDCSNRRLKKIPDNLPASTIELRLDDNMFSEIPSRAFASLKNLIRLDVSRNPIVKVHGQAFEGLEKLNKLSMYDTQLERIPAGLFSSYTKRLEILLLHKNRLKCLPFDSFTSLSGRF